MSASVLRTSWRSGSGSSSNRTPTYELVRIAASGCRSSWVRVAVSSPSVATRATCSSSARFCAAAASACLRAVTSIETPKSFGPLPSSGPTQRPRPCIQRAVPSACCTRYSVSYSPRVWSARSIAPSRATRSSGCTRSKVAAKSRRASGSRPNSERPRSVIHRSLPETSHTHMARFPASAARPIRFALSRNVSFERLSSSMTTASSISGVAVTRRNSCSARAFSVGVCARNGPCPRMVPRSPGPS